MATGQKHHFYVTMLLQKTANIFIAAAAQVQYPILPHYFLSQSTAFQHNGGILCSDILQLTFLFQKYILPLAKFRPYFHENTYVTTQLIWHFISSEQVYDLKSSKSVRTALLDIQ